MSCDEKDKYIPIPGVELLKGKNILIITRKGNNKKNLYYVDDKISEIETKKNNIKDKFLEFCTTFGCASVYTNQRFNEVRNENNKNMKLITYVANMDKSYTTFGCETGGFNVNENIKMNNININYNIMGW